MSIIGEIVKLKPDFQLTKDESPKTNSSYNVLLALKNDTQLNRGLKYNEFTEDCEIVSKIVLGETIFEPGALPASFESALAVYFEQEFGIAFTNAAMKNGLETFFTQKKYNPVKEYMEECEKNWDKKPRIGNLFFHYLGAEDKPLVQSIALIFLVGAVKKVYEPDFKFDYVLDLVGGQGIGKTSILQKIGGLWYTDSITDFQNKDNFELMIRSLIVNDDEMVASKKMGFAELKAFISKTRLRFRKAYARRSEEYPKKFVLARTTNEATYLRDKTGERRFLPVMTGINNQELHPMEMTEAEVKEIWGEAMVLYHGGYPTTFSKKEEEELEIYREQFMYVDEVESLLDDYLEMPIPGNWEEYDPIKRQSYTKNFINNGIKINSNFVMDKVATRDILNDVFSQDVTRGKLSKKISYLMSNKKGWETKTFRRKGKQVRGFMRKK